ncbi:unnamed protein product [Ilex paraguariensis]|uniref:Uncharacterized protein n=1 Tax=Ilex paraguariensis TaxID=185542 RepID=A0ABC8RT38_9AQUA
MDAMELEKENSCLGDTQSENLGETDVILLSLKQSIEESLQKDDVQVIVIIGSYRKLSAEFNVTSFSGI